MKAVFFFNLIKHVRLNDWYEEYITRQISIVIFPPIQVKVRIFKTFICSLGVPWWSSG